MKKNDSIVVCHNVGMRYAIGPEVLTGINFSLNSGDFVFLTGDSGAGKSSFLRLLYLERKPSRGCIFIFGENIVLAKHNDLPRLRRRIGVVLQEFDLLNHMTAFDNVALPLRVRGVSEITIKNQVSELLEWVGLGGVMHVYPPLLSGGQKQRIAIARAVIGRPCLLIADEPTGSVDDCMAKRLLYLFEELNKNGTTVILATHSSFLLEVFSHPIVRLRDGRIHV